MELDDYQERAKEYAYYPKDIGPYYNILGLVSEVGDISSKLNNLLMETNGNFRNKDLKELCQYLGAILWYISNMAADMDVSLDSIACLNLNMLTKLKQELDKENN